MHTLPETYEETVEEIITTLEDHRFAISGGTNLYLREVTDRQPSDIDILTTEEGLERLREEKEDWYRGGNSSILEPGSISETVKVNGEYKVGRFNTNGTSSGILGDNKGVDIDVFGGIRVIENDSEYNPVEETIEIEEVEYDGEEIPLLSLNSELEMYRKLGKYTRKNQVERHLAIQSLEEKPSHMDHLDYLVLDDRSKRHLLENETLPDEKTFIDSIVRALS
jgi:hypothetical protein